MNIKSKYVREQKRYSKNDLMNKFNISLEEVKDLIKKLKTYGVLKMVKSIYKKRDLTDLVDEEVEIVDIDFEVDDYFYVFTFVGVLTVGNIIIKSFPKYLLNIDKPLEEMKQVLKVLKYYNSKEQKIGLYNDDGEQSGFNIVSLILYLLNDYYDNGIYTKHKDIIDTNGEGEILWDRTIDETIPIIINNRPFYTELQTRNTIDDERDYFKRLHKCIITECSRKLEKADLLQLFEMEKISISEESLLDFGDTDYILYRLQSELNVQFETRKQHVIKTLYSYIEHSRAFKDNLGLSMYGTNSFNLVWESVCSEVFDNKLKTILGQLKLPIPLRENYNANAKLLDIIDKPTWIGWGDDKKKFIKKSKDTLKPDLISIFCHDKRTEFLIFDAKYYNIQFEKGKRLRNYPGIGDITKQYLYLLAYKEFIEDHKIKEVRNCFLMPTQGDKIIEKGSINIKMLSDLGLEDIQIRLLPAKKMYDKYLNQKKINIEVLKL